MIKNIGYLDNLIPTTHVLADAVRKMAKTHDVIVMRNHGVLTLGRTMKEAYFLMQLTEESAKVFTIGELHGGARILTKDEYEDLRNLSSEKYRAELLSNELKYYNGDSVQCVIADTCIGGVDETAKCAEKFEREGVGVSITVTPCWCYGSETLDMNPHLPKAV